MEKIYIQTRQKSYTNSVLKHMAIKQHKITNKKIYRTKLHAANSDVARNINLIQEKTTWHYERP